MLLHPASWSETISTPSSFFPYENTTPWQLVSDTLRLSDPHQRHWYNELGSILAVLIQNTEYPRKRQIEILSSFAVLVAPFLGRAPPGGLPRWPSLVTGDHRPVEFSLDFDPAHHRPIVRYSFEPIALDVDTADNQNFGGVGMAFKNALLQRYPTIETSWFDHFESCFNIQNITRRHSELHASPTVWGFSLTNEIASPRAYFSPGNVARATSRTSLETVLLAIASTPGLSSADFPSLQVYSEHAKRASAHYQEVGMLGLDLAPVESARLKIYFRDKRTSFVSVAENMSLGGTLSDVEFGKGLEQLRRLWDTLFGTEGRSEDTDLPHKDHPTEGILYHVKLQVKHQRPRVMIYIPVGHYAQSDDQVRRVLVAHLSCKLGHAQGRARADNYSEVYRRCIDRILKPEVLENGLRFHTYIGCSIEAEGKLRLVVYFNPQGSKVLGGVPEQ